LAEPGDAVRVKMKTGDTVYVVATNQSPEGGMMFIRMGAAGLQVRTDLTRADFMVIGVSGARYEWDFGDGKSLETASAKATHVYDYQFKPATGGGTNPFGEDVQFDTKVYAVTVRVFDAGGKLVETVTGDARLIPLKSVSVSN
jgi:hypothetical protein